MIDDAPLPPEACDAEALLRPTLCPQDHEPSALAPLQRHWVAWAAALAARDERIVARIHALSGPLEGEARRAILLALSRMGVTNPYFFSRQFAQVDAGGNLEALAMRPFDALGVQDATAYHYACIAISMLNGGYMCFRSHLGSLQQAGESDAAIDQAMRLTSAVAALRQIGWADAALARLEGGTDHA